jgi:hypothetical protein
LSNQTLINGAFWYQTLAIRYSQVHPATKEWLAMVWMNLQLCKDSYKATKTCVLLFNTNQDGHIFNY